MLLRPMRKYAAAGLGSAVLAAGLTLVAPSAEAVTAPAPDDAAISWLTRQLGSDNLVDGSLGATIDFGTALARHGGDQATIDRIKSAVDAGISGYATTGLAAAQAAVFYDLAGVDPTTVDGDLVAKVETAIDDTTGVMPEGGYEGGWSQGLAVQALSAGKDWTCSCTEWDKAVAALVAMQNSDGGWDSGSVSTPDDTADALMALIPLENSATPGVDDAITKGISYLTSTQQSSGAWLAFGSESGNSTGLAAQALQLHGDTGPVAKAAVWLRRHQVSGSACDRKLSTQAGAVAASDSALANGETDGLTDPYGYDWYEATIQSFPAMQVHAASTAPLAVATRWVRAGATQPVAVQGLVNGQRGCLSLMGKNRDVVGVSATSHQFAFPAGTRSYKAILKVAGATAAKTVVALAPKTLPVSVSRPTIAKGGSERVVVKGLYPGERVKLTYKGVVVASGSATAEGWFGASLNVGRSAGTKTVYAVGRFTTRKGQTSFTVR
ncbi:prenyltransferase/squalene oxidase repeat-containing protein [Nocardioides ultimimeridianus]